jgi:hypothetical protein
LRTGHEHSDDGPAALAAYRDRIAEIDRVIAVLKTRRQHLACKLEQRAASTLRRSHPP